MAVLSAADRVYRARALHQDSLHFASEFWDVSDLLPYLAAYIRRLRDAEIGTRAGGLELGLAIRRMVAERCMVRWRVEEACFRELSENLHSLHRTLHAARGVVSPEVRSAAILTLQAIEVIRTRDSR